MNSKFAKLEENNRIIYAPDWVIRVDHHHDEWDEPVYDKDGNPVIDPETGKQKTEHKAQDWDTERRELHPTADDYANAKDGPWLPLDSTKPARDGAYFVSTEYGDLVDGRIVRRYDERPIVAPPPRTFSKLKLYAVLSAANLWDALKAWLEAQTYEGMNAWEAFSLAQELTEDHPMFAKWFSAAKTALDVDDATAEELLSKCVKEGY